MIIETCIPDFDLRWTGSLTANYHYFSTIENCWMLLSRMKERPNMWPVIIFIFSNWIQAINTIACPTHDNIRIWYWYCRVPVNAFLEVRFLASCNMVHVTWLMLNFFHLKDLYCYISLANMDNCLLLTIRWNFYLKTTKPHPSELTSHQQR